FDDRFTSEDRRLVGAAAFYLVTPLGVALHELGHAVVIWLFGGHIVDFHFLFYWGYVVPDRSFGPYGDLAVALAGNLVTVAIGALALRHVLRSPANAARNFFWRRIADIHLSMALVFYPLMCLVGFGGDFVAIYRLDTAPVSAPLLALHLAAVGLLWRSLRGRLGRRLSLLCSPLWDELGLARREAEADPSAVCPLLRIGWAHLATGLLEEARPPLLRALELRPGLPAARAMLGQSFEEDDPERAAGELLAALGDGGLDPLLAATSELSLARLQLARGRASEAEPHACAALAGLSGDPGAAQVAWDVALATEATPALLSALDRAADRGNPVARQAFELLSRRAEAPARDPVSPRS
ncbi:MAG: hypothetical protein ACYCWW_18315, partial [Deltaproteobacteria bacterium]